MTLNSKLALTLGALAALGLTAGQSAQAQAVYNFAVTTNSGQLGNGAGGPLYVGQGALGAGGTVFNNVSNGPTGYDAGTLTSGPAVDSFGTAGGNVTLSITNANKYTQQPSSGAPSATSPGALFSQYAFASGNATAAFTLSGLSANSAYTLFLYGADNYSENSAFTVGGVTESTTNTSTDNTAFTPGANYVTFTGLTDSTGAITGTVTGNTAGAAAPFDGLQVQIAAVPEASTTVSFGLLLALGLGGLVAARKRSLSGVSAQ